MLQDAAAGQPTHQLVPDIHVAEGLCQDGAGLLHAPVRGCMQRGPAIMILDVELIASLNQKPEENPNKTFRSSASGFSAQRAVICLMLQTPAPRPGLASQASVQLSQLSPLPPQRPHQAAATSPPSTEITQSPVPSSSPSSHARSPGGLPPPAEAVRLRGTWGPA